MVEQRWEDMRCQELAAPWGQLWGPTQPASSLGFRDIHAKPLGPPGMVPWSWADGGPRGSPALWDSGCPLSLELALPARLGPGPSLLLSWAYSSM